MTPKANREKHEKLRKQPPETEKRPVQPEADEPEEDSLDKTIADSFPASDPPSSLPDRDEDAA